MGNKCCRSDGHVSIDSYANDKHAAYSANGRFKRKRLEESRAEDKADSFEGLSAGDHSDFEAVQIWREQRSFDKPREEEQVPEESSPTSSAPQAPPSPTDAPSKQASPIPPWHETGSDADTVTREKYLIACQLLHKSMIQKKDELTNAERQFLEGLLKVSDDDSLSCVSYEQLAAIEHATQTLDDDPLFMENHPRDSTLIEQIKSEMDVDHFVKSNELDTRSRSAESIELLRELEEEEAILYIATPPMSPIRIDQTFGVDQSVELSLLYSEQNVLHYDYEEGSPERVKIDLRPSIMRLLSAQEAVGTQMPSNTLPLPTSNDTSEPQQNKSSFLDISGANLVEDDDDVYSPYDVLGAESSSRRILTPAFIEALRGFLPYVVSEENFWLKFTLEKDGDSLSNLLHSIRGSKYTFFAIRSGNRIFGSFTGTQWRKQEGWYGTGEAFLWRVEDSLKVYPYTGSDTCVQYCTNQMVAIGGGDWREGEYSPYKSVQQQPKGIGLLIDADLQGGESNSCATFCNPTLSGDTQEFTIHDLEVWTLTPCHNIAEAEKLEMHKIFVEENRKK